MAHGKVLMSTHDEMTTGAGGQAAPSSAEHASGLVQRDEVRGRHARAVDDIVPAVDGVVIEADDHEFAPVERITPDSTVARTYDDPFPNPGPPHHEPRRTDVDPRAARRADRQVAGMFGLATLLLIGFIVSFVAVDMDQMISLPLIGKIGAQNALFGVTIGGALALVGVGLVHWARKTMTAVELVEPRHPLRSPEPKREEGAAAFRQGIEETGIGRRPFLIGGSLLAALGGLLTAPLVLLRDLGPLPEKKLRHTAWAIEQRIVYENTNEQVKASDMHIGTLVAAHPLGVEDPNRLAKASIFLIRLDPSEVKSQRQLDWGYQGIFAFSRICPHVGCPVDLYEQASHHLLCPCHQSTFDMTDGAKVIFGPAARALPQLQITADGEGNLKAKGDFTQPVGPSFWERG
jgi:ubiquinol-cytochrome c reductase iron-sulfur subunit